MFNILYGFLNIFNFFDFIVIFMHSKTKKKDAFEILGVKITKYHKSEIAIL